MMMNRRGSLWATVGVVFCVGTLAFAAVGEEESSREKTSVGVRLSELDIEKNNNKEKEKGGDIQPLREGVFSAAAGLHILHLHEGRPQEDKTLLEALRDMELPVLRLPGGDDLNTWSWRKGRNMERPDSPPMHIPAWKQLLDAGDSEPLWGINVHTSSTADTVFLCNEIERLALPSRYFELGNELYIRHWEATVSEYIESARDHAKVIRKRFPEAKLGAPIASLWGIRKGAGDDERFEFLEPDQIRFRSDWVLNISEQDFVDALVAHLYLTPREIDDYRDCSRQAVIDWAWTRSGAAVLKDQFDAVSALAPENEIWSTEWGFNTTQYEERNRGENRYHAHLTMLAVLHDARFMLNTAVHCPKVTLLTNWTLVDQPAVAIYKRNRGPTIKHAMFRMLRRAYEGADGVAELKFQTERDLPVITGPAKGMGFEHYSSPAVDVFGFFKGDILQSAVILNILEYPQTISLPQTGGGDSKAVCLHSDSLLPDWGNPDNPPFRDWSPPYEIESLSVEEGTVTVPGGSLSVVQFFPDRD
ncbi:MAG: hypothetical protein ACLFV4_06625 [Candidatus Hydrogenedentota bacterium]